MVVVVVVVAVVVIVVVAYDRVSETQYHNPVVSSCSKVCPMA